MKVWTLLLQPALLMTLGCQWFEHSRRPPDKLTPVAALPVPARPGVVASTPAIGRIEFTGSTSLMSQSGHFEQFDGTLEVPSDDLREAKLRATVDMTSTTTKIGLLTKHLKAEDFFDVDRYPTAEFVSTRITPAGGPGNVVVAGRLTLHGVTRPIEFPATLRLAGDEVTFDGTMTVRQTAFGMTESASKTKDEVPVRVTFRGRRR